MKLVVASAFANYAKGDEITDKETIQTILASEDVVHVVKVATADVEAEPEKQITRKK